MDMKESVEKVRETDRAISVTYGCHIRRHGAIGEFERIGGFATEADLDAAIAAFHRLGFEVA